MSKKNYVFCAYIPLTASEIALKSIFAVLWYWELTIIEKRNTGQICPFLNASKINVFFFIFFVVAVYL